MVARLAPRMSHGNVGGTQLCRRSGFDQWWSTMPLLQLVCTSWTLIVPSPNAELDDVASSRFWEHWHWHVQWLRLRQSILQPAVS